MARNVSFKKGLKEKKAMKKLLAIVLCVAIVLSLASLVGCSKNDNPVVENFADFSEELTTEKVGTVDTDDYMMAKGGLYYKTEENLYGIISFNGKYDTGAKFARLIERDNYFMVSTKIPKSTVDYASINTLALADGKGKILIPQAYAYYHILNEKYVQAYTVTGVTGIEDNALVTLREDDFELKPADERVYLVGEWCVYDITTGKIVSGVKGTNNKYVIARGNYITYHADGSDDSITVDGNGNPLPEDAYIFEDGSYRVEGKEGAIYDTNGKLLFNYDLTSYEPKSITDDRQYYHASRYADDKYVYVLLNKKGEVVTSEFEEDITNYGEIIHSNKGIYNFKGEKIVDGVYSGVDYESSFTNTWLLREGDVYTMILADGSVIYQGKDKKDVTVYPDDFVASKKDDGEYMFYSFKDKDYTIKGYSFAPWIVKTPSANGLYNIVDTISGNIIAEGYSGYTFSNCGGKGLFIYAKYNGGTDIYQILSLRQVEAFRQKKENLLNDLIAAFEKEGIKVTVNKETGEMSMDSSVLFGGDSAVLTAQGKSFLDKFTRAYTSIVFSETYRSFVSRTMVEGHIAPIAGSTYSSGLPLSRERANNVKDYCVSVAKGGNSNDFANTLVAVGYSNTQPIYKSNGEADLAASRRVSFRVMLDIE